MPNLEDYSKQVALEEVGMEPHFTQLYQACKPCSSRWGSHQHRQYHHQNLGLNYADFYNQVHFFKLNDIKDVHLNLADTQVMAFEHLVQLGNPSLHTSV